MSEAVDERGGDEIGLWDRLRWLWWVAAAVLLASLAVTAWGYLRDRQLDAATRHDNALIIATERLLSSLKDVETGQRGFIITGKDEYLDPYRSGLAAVPADLATVSALDGPEAQPLADLVERSGQRSHERGRSLPNSRSGSRRRPHPVGRRQDVDGPRPRPGRRPAEGRRRAHRLSSARPRHGRPSARRIGDRSHPVVRRARVRRRRTPP